MAGAEFIDSLVADLRPVRPAASWTRAVSRWIVASWAVVAALILATGPLREGALSEVVTSTRFATELLVGSAAGLTAIWAGLEIGVPGGPPTRRLLVLPILLLLAWIALVVADLGHASLDPDMTGKRAHCVREALLFSIPPLALALAQLRRRALLATRLAGCVVGVAAATIPAVWMQIACMDDPAHALMHHLAPIAPVGLLGMIAGGLVVARR